MMLKFVDETHHLECERHTGRDQKRHISEFVAEYDPDILCLQETKAEQGQAEIDLPQYEEYWNSSSGRKGYSGTAIFSKIKPRSVALGFPAAITKKFNLSDDYGELNGEGASSRPSMTTSIW